jgi:DNA-binding transcriptional ArsR family regulator
MSRASARADVFHAVADANRRGLLDRLARGEAPVGALVDHSRLSYSAVSKHLAVLHDAGLVRRRRSGRQRLYRLEPAPLREVYDWTTRYEVFWATRLARLRDVLDEDGPA